MKNLSEQVASRETECEALKIKSEADDKLIDLLKSQNEEQAHRITQMQREFDAKLNVLVQERDEANAKAQEVRGVIETVGRLALQGIDRMVRRHDPDELSQLIDIPPARDAAQITIEKYRDQLDPDLDPPPLFLRSEEFEPMRRAG